MLTFEEMVLATRALAKKGYSFAYYFGNTREGFTLRASKHPPLAAEWWQEPFIEISRPEDLAQYMATSTVSPG